MEPLTKKIKQNPLALHDAISNVHHAMRELDNVNYEIVKIFRRNKEAAKVRDTNGYYPLYLVCHHRPWCLNHPSLTPFVIELLYYYPDAIRDTCWRHSILNPLHVAAYHDDPQLVLVILDKNISLLNKLDNDHQTPLQIAVKHSSKKAAETILKFPNVDINNIDNKGLTVLFNYKEWRLMAKLLQYPNINVRVKDHCGHSAFYLFLRFVHQNHYKYTKHSQIFKVIKLFMRIPGSLKSRNNMGETIIHSIIGWSNPDLLSVILSEYAILLTKVDILGDTPLHKACGRCGIELLRETKNRNNYFVCLDILLHYIDCNTLNLKANTKQTALHMACSSENDVAVKKLLQHPDLHLNSFDRGGVSPLFETIYKSELLFEEADRDELTYRPSQAWNLTCLRLLLDHDECLIFGRTRDGDQLIDLARNRFHLLCNVPVHKRNESLTNDFLEIIEEIEHYMVKARLKMFHFFQKKLLSS
jgi:ankyrin repeat protein